VPALRGLASAVDTHAAVRALGEVDNVALNEVQSARETVELELAEVEFVGRFEGPVDLVACSGIETAMKYSDYQRFYEHQS
jgi:hypothetical protein